MLQIRIHCAQNCCISAVPAMQDCSRQTSLAFPDKQAHTRVMFSDRRYDFGCSIAAVIVHDDYLVSGTYLLKGNADALQKNTNVPSFANGGYDESQLLPIAIMCLKRSWIDRAVIEGYAT